MLHLIQSNKMEQLAEQLAALLRDNRTADNLFEPDQVLVQSPGMAQWLKLQLADSLGIAANIEFPLPSSFIWRLYLQHIDGLPKQSAFTKDNMAWKLMQVLPSLVQSDEFEAIARYLSDKDPLKTYQLCHKIADVYDQYLVYRPDWILQWEAGEDSLADVEVARHPWQPILWRALVEYTQRLEESPYHRANLHQTLMERLRIEDDSDSMHRNNAIKDSVKPIVIFGISALPKQQLEVFAQLAQHREVVIFWVNPSAHFWADIVDEKRLAKAQLNAQQAADYLEVGNPLLASWGKLGRDYLDMLLALDVQQHDAFIEHTPDSLLHCVQHDVLHLSYREALTPLPPEELFSNGEQYPKHQIAGDDVSLQVHACHSKVRELEVLHDHLLRCFSQDPALSAKDIIVMMPDVTSYAPYIDGVFGGAAAAYRIPYGISDRSLLDESGILPCFSALMTLHQTRLTLPEVLSILEVPAVMRKFSIDSHEFDSIRFWLSDAGVRWGWDGEDKTRWQLPAEQQNTWLFGLHRLLSGYAMTDVTRYSVGDMQVAPYADIEGQQAQALGKFFLFCEMLLEALDVCMEAQPLAEKVASALKLIERAFCPDEQEELHLNGLRQTVESLTEHARQYPGDVNQDVFATALDSRLSESGVGQRFLAGSVNFCTLMPMRSIPFRHVCILGMGEADYPRQTTPVGFDLMREATPRKGDRSRRMDDRYLFLEALLSARDSVYISYVGVSQRDNSELPPSVLLSELLEYCEYGFCRAGDEDLDEASTRQKLRDSLVTLHRLQPFSKDYYTGALPRSFNARWMAVKSQVSDPVPPFFTHPLPLLPEMLDERQLEIDDLIRFLCNPALAFMQRRWQTRLNLWHDDISEDEAFAVDPLQRYQLLEILVASITQQQTLDVTDTAAQLKAQGILPIANSGPLALETLLAQSESLVKPLQSLQADKVAERREVRLTIGDWQLEGWVDGIYGKQLIDWRPGKVRVKDRLSLWVRWLCLCADPGNPCTQANFVATRDSFTLTPLPAEDARAHLSGLLELYRQGASQFVPLLPETGWQWVKTGKLQKTLDAFIGSDDLPGEGAEPHISRCVPDLSSQLQGICDIAQSVLGPLHEGTSPL